MIDEFEKSEVSRADLCLTHAYAAFGSAPTDSDKNDILEKYLDCFPSRFSDFEELFGFDMKTEVAGPLYDKSFDYFNFIAENYDSFDKIEFSKKFISLAIGATGRPYVDAEGLLQRSALAPMVRDPSIGLVILSKHSSSEIERYWYFVLDNVERGTKTNEYSCPDEFGSLKACKVLSVVKNHPRKNTGG